MSSGGSTPQRGAYGAATQRCLIHPERLAELRSLVCPSCELMVRDALRASAELWDDLLEPGGSVQYSQIKKVRTSAPPALVPAARLEGRSEIRAKLVGWCQVLEEERQISLPVDDMAAIAHHVGIHAGTLLAMDGPAQGLVEDCEGILRLRRVAYPVRRTGVTIPCKCGVDVKIEPGAAWDEVKCPGCGEWGTVHWWRDQWRERTVGDTWRPMLLRDVATWLVLQHEVAATYVQVRQWVSRARLDGYMLDERGRVLYDPEAVLALAVYRRVA